MKSEKTKGIRPQIRMAVALGAACWATATFAQLCGPSWSTVGEGLGGGQDPIVHTLTVFDDDGPGPNLPALYVGGRFTSAGGAATFDIARWDGSSWAPVGAEINGPVFNLIEFDDDGAGPNLPSLHASGWLTGTQGPLTSNIARWNGATWSSIPGLAGNNNVSVLCGFDDDGDGLPALFAGGLLQYAGGARANRIAKWNGNFWSDMGGGVSGNTSRVRSLAVFDDDGAGPNLPSLYVGGRFTMAGMVTVNQIARWNGATWSSLGSGVSGPENIDGVYALTVFDDDDEEPRLPALYVAGRFPTAGPLETSGIARWDGSSWSAVGNGFERISLLSGATSLVAFDEDGPGPNRPALYAGDHITLPGSTGIEKIAKWDGATWSAIESGINYGDIVLAVFDDDGPGPTLPALYVGGDFTMAGGLPLTKIARWGRPAATGDKNGDGSLSLNDYTAFQDCLTGPLADFVAHGCCLFDFDYDQDADLADVANIQLMFSGE